MESDPVRLTLTVDAGGGMDDEDRAELARHLRRQLLETDIDSVEFAYSGAPPAGAKSDPMLLSTLALAIAPGAISAMISMLPRWLSRYDRASVTVESGSEKFTLTGTLSPEQEQMVASFLDRHKL